MRPFVLKDWVKHRSFSASLRMAFQQMKVECGAAEGFTVVTLFILSREKDGNLLV